MAAQLIGRHIVTDPGICHGKPTFRGTRILVSDVLAQIADGMAWESVIQEWHGASPGKLSPTSGQLQGQLQVPAECRRQPSKADLGLAWAEVAGRLSAFFGDLPVWNRPQ